MSLDDFFTLSKGALTEALAIEGPTQFLESANREQAIFRAREEYKFVKRHNIKVLFITDDDYPWNLREVADAPVVIYQLGETVLNDRESVAMVGTRRPTAPGLDICASMVRDLAIYLPDTLIVSGLAYGIDAAAHTAALDAGLPTAAVVAHGLQMIYPASHRDLARRIISSGGSILSEYPSGETPYRQRFLERNRIVAGLCDATVVVESPVRGGAMSTANTAFSYSREVLAVPGRPSDENSAGCNLLIRKHKASLATCAGDIMEQMGWSPRETNIRMEQRNLFPELDGDCRTVYDTLRMKGEPLTPDLLHTLTRLPIAKIMSALGEMEFEGIVARHPGNRYSTV